MSRQDSSTWVTARQFNLDSMIDNICAILEHSTTEDIHTGLNWYLSARGLVDRLSVKSGRSTHVVTGILAALSPASAMALITSALTGLNRMASWYSWSNTLFIASVLS